MKMAAAREI